ncbi:ThuA domain-containing protein [Candidatus Sumerlaeota bacterium]|nr:ThuA domain-containing protein [Candidatus Sumerlaeota bacterium]
MRGSIQKALISLGVAGALAACAVLYPCFAAETKLPRAKVLLLVAGPMHDHKAIGKVVEQSLKDYGRFDVTKVEGNLNALLAEKLKPYDVIIYFNTAFKLSDQQREGVIEFVAKGKGLVVVHSGADTTDKQWEEFIGCRSVCREPRRKHAVEIRDKNNPITAGMENFEIEEEDFGLRFDIERVTILAISPGKDMYTPPMPAAYTMNSGEGRIVYISFGHDAKVCSDPNFKKLLCRGALWAAAQPLLEPAPKPAE